MEIKLRGRFMLRTFDPKGNLTQEVPWFDNLITNQGLDQIGGYQPAYNAGGPFLNIACSVGTGTTTPTTADTQQGAFLAATPNVGTAVTSVTTAFHSGTPDFWSCIWVYTFSAGVATGTISEIGVGNWTTVLDTQPFLFSHALITSGGTPTTITVLSSESLEVTYELDYIINVTTNTYSFSMSSVTYSGNYLRSNITSPPALNQCCAFGNLGANNPFLSVYNGTTTTVTGIPTGSASGGTSGCTTTSAGTYSNGTYFNTFTTAFSISQGNVSGGISAFTTNHVAHGSYQFSVTPTIPKTSSYQMTLTYAYSWARYP